MWTSYRITLIILQLRLLRVLKDRHRGEKKFFLENSQTRRYVAHPSGTPPAQGHVEFPDTQPYSLINAVPYLWNQWPQNLAYCIRQPLLN
ncbi:hypothetical protein T4D_4546 [Trichinella pseudospiralis]|uniref:Uncharacterized protein n=1 Tax=Trichinella pseudospiralis TaxID=6337 RepID=A0A0V1FFQ5_TRIPS|nr:hypothetical protein T4D_4546 [Trichinella pseudospiralis]